MPASMVEEKRAVLTTLQNLLRLFGDANDAEDHGFPEAAQQERSDAHEGIQKLIAEHSFISDLLPSLQKELESEHILTFGWAEFYEAIDVYLLSM